MNTYKIAPMGGVTPGTDPESLKLQAKPGLSPVLQT